MSQTATVAARERSPHGITKSAGASAPLIAIASLALAATAVLSRVLAVDSFYDLYAGRYIAARGLPDRNLATVAAHGAPWTDQQWLAHLAYYAAWRAGGYPAAAALSALLVTAGFALLGALMLRRGVPPLRMFAWTAAAMLVCVPAYQVEAQSFAFPLFAVTLWLLIEDTGTARTWLVVPVLALWANLHGSVLLGAGLAVCYALYRAVRPSAAPAPTSTARIAYLALAATCAACVLCTPYGLLVIGYYRDLIGNPVLPRYIARWAPPDPAAVTTWIFGALVVAVLAAIAAAWRRGPRANARSRPDPVLAAIAAALLVLALVAARNEDWFAIAGTLLAADTLAGIPAARASSIRFPALLAGMLAAVAVASIAALAVEPASQFEIQVPHGAVAAAARDPGPILGDVYTGTSMLWLEPATFGRVGFDVRLEQYSQAQLSAYLDYLFVRGPHWSRITRGYQVLVVSRGDAALLRAVSRLQGWHVAYSDRQAAVFRRIRQPGGPR